ncbi:MAG: hypothetical protein GY765_15095 [bacterium]|nr:hypothetical protein [bacterium]
MMEQKLFSSGYEIYIMWEYSRTRTRLPTTIAKDQADIHGRGRACRQPLLKIRPGKPGQEKQMKNIIIEDREVERDYGFGGEADPTVGGCAIASFMNILGYPGN